MIAEALEVGIDNEFIGPKNKNPDLDNDYFASLGYRNKFEKNLLLFYFNKIWNWVNKTFFNKAVRTDLNENDLKELVLDIVDDVYKE